MPIRFCTIATELVTGHEIWLTRGPLVQAMRASYALPGVFDPVLLRGRWLMDGALVNPIPITAARALGADVVICVNLNSEVRARGTVIQSYDADARDRRGGDRGGAWTSRAAGGSSLRPGVNRPPQAPTRPASPP